MKDRVERFVILPFSIGCASKASVALGKSGDDERIKQCQEQNTIRREKEENSSSSLVKKKKKKNGFINFISLPKPNISGGMQRLIQRIKSLSQIFVYKEEIEETEKEMEIGFPTDVKHVTHIGLDGTRTINPEVPSFPTISIKQFEIAMASQSHHHNQPPVLVDLNNLVTENI